MLILSLKEIKSYPNLFGITCPNCNLIPDIVWTIEQLLSNLIEDNKRVKEIFDASSYDIIDSCDCCAHTIYVDGVAKDELDKLIIQKTINYSIQNKQKEL